MNNKVKIILKVISYIIAAVLGGAGTEVLM